MVERVKRRQVRSYILEKQPKKRRKWQGKREEQAVFQKRRCIASTAGVYCGGAASGWNAALPTVVTPAA